MPRKRRQFTPLTEREKHALRVKCSLVDRSPEATEARQRALTDALFNGAGSLKRAWRLAYRSDHCPSLNSLMRSPAIRSLFRDGLSAGRRLPAALEDRVKLALNGPADPLAAEAERLQRILDRALAYPDDDVFDLDELL